MEDFSKQNMDRHLGKNYVLLILVSIGLGGVIGAIVGSFMYAQHYLIEFLWETIPHQLGGLNSYYILLIAILGGLAVGMMRKYLGSEPQPMHAIIQSIKTGKNLPGIKSVPAAFLLSLISLGFGGALGPEAALVGISVGFSSWAGDIMTRFATKFHLAELKKPWSNIPGYLAMASGFVIFSLVAIPMFGLEFAYFPYQFSIDGYEILTAILLGFVGLLLGEMFSQIGSHLDKLLAPLKTKPVFTSLLGGILLGVLGMVSPLVLFSGQLGLGSLFEQGLEMSGIFLILIGILKMIATKANTATGWKGGEFFPVMFSSAAIGLGIANLVPGMHPMVAIAALMAATVSIVMDNMYIALAIVLMFLPVNLAIPMVVASLVAVTAKKKITFSPGPAAQKVPVEVKE